jgi:L-threonylcarbamoyladenylate synthase
METKKIWLKPDSIKQDKELQEAAALLRQGEVVAFPTETVYGLGANALDSKACAKIYAVKGRPSDNPLIVHVATLDEAKQLVRVWPQQAEICARNFWPGPLTLVLPKRTDIPEIVSGGLDTVAVRMPNHPVALALIEAAGCPLAAPSANISGKPSPTNADHVWRDLKGKIPLLIDAGSCTVGLESTVLDLTGELPTVLRPGGITLEQLRAVLGKVELDRSTDNGLSTVKPRSPGMKYRHYAPLGEIILFSGSTFEKAEKIMKYLRNKNNVARTAVLCLDETIARLTEDTTGRADMIFVLGSRNNLDSAASRLFEGLRLCDEQNIDIILAEEIAEEGIGLAFMNRLKKAAGKEEFLDQGRKYPGLTEIKEENTWN